MSKIVTTTHSAAEIAAALMDQIHTEVTRQDEGSDSAYAELLEVLEKAKLNVSVIWRWVAVMADAAVPRMELRWASGECSFEECMQPMAQEFHNYITDPKTRPVKENTLTLERAEAMWEAAVVCAREYREACAAAAKSRS